MSGNEYLDFVAPTSQGELAQIQQLAEAQAEAEQAVAEAELALTKAKEALKLIAETQLPEAMDACGMTEFKTRSGLIVRIRETIRASIPKAMQVDAFRWLRAHGHESMIKRNVVVAFGKGEDESAAQLYAELSARDLHPEDNVSVHSSTLSAWAKEKLEKGEEVPQELFGIFRQREAKITTK